ncbi:MAG: hypothetical protein ACLFSY_01445 [Desulfonatronovibrionaceae bacterium]
MIIIDGQQSDVRISNYDNLEDILVRIMEDGHIQNRVVTDVLVNNENFSEIYPHQAEDLETEEIEKLEIKTVSVSDMAVNITRELYKVLNLMARGGSQAAELFRVADDAEALDMYQDLLEVTRDFLGMVGTLRDQFRLRADQEFEAKLQRLSELFSEMIEVQENEDYVLLSDLLEYEYLPHVEEWKAVVAELRKQLKQVVHDERNE